MEEEKIMSHESCSSATHQVHTGIINEFLIKGATALTLQVGVLTRPLLTRGSCAVTLRSHQNIIKLSQHAHSSVISFSLLLSLTRGSYHLFFFFFFSYLVTCNCEPPSQIAAGTKDAVNPRPGDRRASPAAGNKPDVKIFNMRPN